MEPYPRTMREFETAFATEDACRAYLASLRWPDGFVCPACSGRSSWTSGRGLRVCGDCGRQVSVTAGTIFQDTKLPLTTWFRIAWLVTSQKGGVSAQGLQRVLGVGSYRTAWTCLHKFRRAMVRPGREPLEGVVEIDESYVGGLEPGKGRRHVGKKALVVVAAEIRGDAIGRIRLGQVVDASEKSLLPFVKANVRSGSTIVTDGHGGYGTLGEHGYRHDRRVQGERKNAVVILPRVHRVASLLQRWLLGTHQGGVERRHLDYYLDEFVFRFNRRGSRHRGKLFQRLLEQAVDVPPVTYGRIIAGSPRNRGPKR